MRVKITGSVKITGTGKRGLWSLLVLVPALLLFGSCGGLGDGNVSSDKPGAQALPEVEEVTILYPADTVEKGKSYSFTATVKGTGNPSQEVSWSVLANGGSASAFSGISENGILTVGVNETASALTIVAESKADPSKFDMVTVTVSSEDEAAVTGVSLDLGSASVAKGAYQIFNATVKGTDGVSQEVTWSITGATESRITNEGVLVVGVSEKASSLMVKAVSRADPSISATAMVQLSGSAIEVGGVAVNPGSDYIIKGTSGRFYATVEGYRDVSQEVLWSIEGSSSSSISPTGLLTVPTGETAVSLTVKAVSVADSAKFGTATVYIFSTYARAVSAVIIDGNGASLLKGKYQIFQATVNGPGDPPQDVTWSVVTDFGGRANDSAITQSGVLTVGRNENAGGLKITAVSKFDPSKSGSAIITLMKVTGITITAADGGMLPFDLERDTTYNFKGTVSGIGNPAPEVEWVVTTEPWVWESTTVINRISGTGEGELYVAANESAENLLIKAISRQDPSVYKEVKIPMKVPDPEEEAEPGEEPAPVEE